LVLIPLGLHAIEQPLVDSRMLGPYIIEIVAEEIYHIYATRILRKISAIKERRNRCRSLHIESAKLPRSCFIDNKTSAY